MNIKDIMTKEAACGARDDDLRHIAELMVEYDCGEIPICDDGHKPVGVVTDRDITVRATAEGYDPEVAQVRDAMTASVLFCLEDDSVEDAAERMAEAGVRRLVVLDRSKELVGLLSLDDLAARVDGCLAGEVMEDVARPDRG